MAKQLFPDTHKWRIAIELVNEVDDSRFPLLLSRVLQKLHLKESTFTEKEENSLLDLLQLDSKALQTVLSVCAYAFQQAAYHRVSSKALDVQLDESGMTESKRRAFTTVWQAEGETFVEHLRSMYLGGVPVLKSVDWQMGLCLSQDSFARLNEPRVQMQFNTVDQDSEQTNSITVELEHSEMRSFYEKLETIQSQLDSLT